MLVPSNPQSPTADFFFFARPARAAVRRENKLVDVKGPKGQIIYFYLPSSRTPTPSAVPLSDHFHFRRGRCPVGANNCTAAHFCQETAARQREAMTQHQDLTFAASTRAVLAVPISGVRSPFIALLNVDKY